MASGTSRTQPGAGKRVIVVDDDALAAMAMVLALKAAGHWVVSVEDERETVAACHAHRPDAVLLDIGLPHVSGYDVAAAIRAAPGLGDVFLIAATGYGDDPDRARALESGFDLHLTKPISPATLLDVLAELPPPDERLSRRRE
jgi:CheY-like chemotaxis protein